MVTLPPEGVAPADSDHEGRWILCPDSPAATNEWLDVLNGAEDGATMAEGNPDRRRVSQWM